MLISCCKAGIIPAGLWLQEHQHVRHADAGQPFPPCLRCIYIVNANHSYTLRDPAHVCAAVCRLCAWLQIHLDGLLTPGSWLGRLPLKVGLWSRRT